MCFFCERKHHQLLFVFLCITSYSLDCYGYHHSHQLVLVPKERWIASVETKYLMGSSDGAKGWLEQVCWGAEGTISWEVVVFLSLVRLLEKREGEYQVPRIVSKRGWIGWAWVLGYKFWFGPGMVR